MWYAILCRDRPASLDLRLRIRSAHLAWLKQLQAEGRLLLAGPHPAIEAEDPGPAGFTGSLIVAEFASLDEAQHWANADPYTQAGVFTHVEIKPFKRTLP